MFEESSHGHASARSGAVSKVSLLGANNLFLLEVYKHVALIGAKNLTGRFAAKQLYTDHRFAI
jgi:hypothetical protein